MTYLDSDASHCDLLDIRPGYPDQRWLRAGTTIIARDGIFHLAEAVYLDGQTVCTRQLLREGQTHRVEQTGWVVFGSALGGRALCIARPSAWRQVAHAVSRHLRQWMTGSVKPL